MAQIVSQMTDRKKPGVAFWATIALVVALVPTYAFAYLCMAHPPRSYLYSGRGPFDVTPVYGDDLAGQQFWKAVFGPAHWIDRRIRLELWTVGPFF